MQRRLLALPLLLLAGCSDPTSGERPDHGVLSLDGMDDFAQIEHSPVFNVGRGDFTLEACVKRSRTGRREDVLDKKAVFRDSWHDVALLIDGRNRANVYLSERSRQVYLPSRDTIGTDWTHIAATRANGTVTLFVNGKPQASVVAREDVSSDGPLRIGANRLNNADSGAAPVYPFAGLIDEVRFWDVARSPEQIVESMSQRLSGEEPGLVAYYTFGGSGSHARDEAGSNPGSLVNGATLTRAEDAPVP